MSKLTIEEIDGIAHLARLELTESEKEKYARELSVIFDYMKMLEEVNTDRVEETCQVTGLSDVTRADVVEECDKEVRDKLIVQFPAKAGNLLRVKKVFDNSETL